MARLAGMRGLFVRVTIVRRGYLLTPPNAESRCRKAIWTTILLPLRNYYFQCMPIQVGVRV